MAAHAVATVNAAIGSNSIGFNIATARNMSTEMKMPAIAWPA
jgi:hypothetical protein